MSIQDDKAVKRMQDELKRCERIATNDMKSRWLWGYIDGLRFALKELGEEPCL